MAYIKKLFDHNFMQYASYVIKDRAIPDLEDGLKPVQRRILHTLFEADDGKFHKVANIVGACMKYHPHGDASIYSALVVLANKDLFIDKQGNFGNMHTGDEASAARYIECRVNPLARELLYRPEITEYIDSYDGRNREPVHFPAKLPVVLAIGAEGIAVGMSTRILPHNLQEILHAEIACLRGKKFQIYPDFPSGGLADVSGYEDGNGKVLLRAKVDVSDPKRIVVRELPAGSTSESLIASVENAARAGRIKIAGIADFTTDKVEIEIKLARGEYAQETLDALYAFTECEQSISCNLLVIKDGKPALMTVTEIIRYHAQHLVDILTAELKLEKRQLEDKLHARTLERIFIEERVYKGIERMKSEAGVYKAVFDGLAPFQAEIRREVTQEDVERLLKIPIRRISLYDIERARAEMEEIKARKREVEKHLKAIVDYAVSFLEGVLKRTAKDHPRLTELQRFTKVDVKEVARRNLSLRYDPSSGYLGTSVSGGQELFTVSSFDRVLVIRRTGSYSVTNAPDKLFVDKGLLHCMIADKETLSAMVFSLIYRDPGNGHPYIKRFKIEGFILNKDYFLAPDGAEILAFDTRENAEFSLHYVKKPRQKVKDEAFVLSDFAVKGLKAMGVRLAHHEVETASFASAQGRELFDLPPSRRNTGTGKPEAGEAGGLLQAAAKLRGKAKDAAPAKSSAKKASGSATTKGGKTPGRVPKRKKA